MNEEELEMQDFDEPEFENSAPVITEIRDKPTFTPKSLEDSPTTEDNSETEERIRIQNMSPEETMKYLAQSLSEINAPIDYDDIDIEPPPPQASPLLAQAFEEEAPPDTPAPLTTEPIWGDIYIKASRSLRELCESGKLSMEQIETEVREKLLPAAEQFATVTKDKSRIPKVLIPKITELKSAASNFETYFQAGEDIATRAMFFMLYQMLSYADRIVETPETKENINDFFRRFGTAGIMLSMLDVRV